MHVERGLLIQSPWIENILAGEKTWEIRGSRTNIRGPIGLIRSKSGLIVGTCEVVGAKVLTRDDLTGNVAMHCVGDVDEINYANPHAWILAKARPLVKPVPYNHPSGAVIWVRLDMDLPDES